MAVRTSPPFRTLPRLLYFAAVAASLLYVFQRAPHAQGIGAHRGEIGGTGGTRSIQGYIVSSSGRLPDTRVRITLDISDSGARSVVAGEDGVFIFNNLVAGSYDLTIDAGKEYEIMREPVYLSALDLKRRTRRTRSRGVFGVRPAAAGNTAGWRDI
ncbi:MAG: Carboxypeptidase regulatory-like domain [Acidobacteriota bacterium]|nr:Carboxypeptidase regulatory-like domain [Acidobacteriota bacterium]